VIGIDKAGHWLHHDRLDEFLKIVRDFLAPARAEERRSS
jgi:pimeloyl-ACP methyl ester carboxylesterase